MRMVHLFLLLTLSLAPLNNTLTALDEPTLLGNIEIYQDSPEMDNVGYNNCDMTQNGEKEVMHLINNDDVVFDVGANVGNWSLQALEGKGSLILHCFEPLPKQYEELKCNLKKYNANLSRLALSDVQGHCVFCYYPSHPSLSTIHRRDRKIEEWLHLKPEFIDVETELLDNYCKSLGINQIDFLKIDTEGHEFAVISGAENLLSNHAIRMIQFEYGGCYLDAQTTFKDVFDLLTKYGYTIYRIIPKGLVKINSWRPELENFQYCNYLAIYNGE